MERGSVENTPELKPIYSFFFQYLFLILTRNIYDHRLIARVKLIWTPFTSIVIRVLAVCSSVVCPFWIVSVHFYFLYPLNRRIFGTGFPSTKHAARKGMFSFPVHIGSELLLLSLNSAGLSKSKSHQLHVKL